MMDEIDTKPKPEIREVNPERIVAAPFHHRTDWSHMPALTMSVRARGIIHLPVCRLVPKPGGEVGQDIQMVAGACRIRSAIEIGMARIQVVLHHDMSDEEALDIQIEENLRRAGMHPLDECDYYHDLLGLGVDKSAIAKRFKQPRARVESRLVLRNLSELVRKAYAKGEIDHDVAAHLAKLPVKDQQAAVLAAVRSGALGDAADVAAYIRSKYLLSLADVPWVLDDAAMPGGPCTRCPKRTGTQRELFEDLAGSADLCTDSVCHRGKMDRSFQIQLECAGVATGLARVLEDANVDDVFVAGSGGVPTVVRASGYVEATTPCPTVPGRTWLQAAQDAGASPVLLLIQDQNGRPRMLLDEGDVKKFVRKAAREEGSVVSDARDAADPAIAENRQRNQTARAEMKALVRAIALNASGAEALASVTRLAIAQVFSASTVRVVAEAFGVEVDFLLPMGKTPEVEWTTSILAALVVAECGALRPAPAALRDLARALCVEIAA